jgi:signal transduction histidine kinase
MGTHRWLGSFRRPIVLMLLVTLVPSILLVILGWRLFREDRDGELRALRERRERAAERVGLALQRALRQVETRLDQADPAQDFAQLAHARDAALITVRDDGFDVRPAGRVAYVPAVPRPQAGGGNPSAAGESLILRAQDLRRQKRFEDALETYSRLARLPPSVVEGVPTDLFARWARCDLLASLGHREESAQEAKALLDDLHGGRWALTRDVYETNRIDAAAWAGVTLSSELSPAERLAAAADEIFVDRPVLDRARAALNERRLVPAPDGYGVAIIRTVPARTVAFVALPSFVEREWLAAEQRWLRGQNMERRLQDQAAGTAAATDLARLPAYESGLPWTIAVSTTDVAAELAAITGRRNMWLLAFAALGMLILAGAATAVRAVSNELAVARLQSDFVSAVSHEFRTPLTSLRQIGEVLQDDRVTTEHRRQSYYSSLLRQTDRLQRLVEALLDFGRMEAGAARYRREPIALDQLAQDVVSQYLDEAASRHEPVSIHVNFASAVALVDRDAMSNAIRNLIENAIKYSPACPEAWVDVRPEENGVAVTVRDRGMGIPLSEQRDIFRKFTRGARATAARIRGTGIGLAIVHHVVTAHDGRISVHSEPDTGSTFTIWLPAAAAHHPVHLS